MDDLPDRPAETAADLVARYEKDGSPEPLDRAIDLFRAALDRCPEDSALLLNYSKALLDRAWRLGRPEDANASVAACLDLLRLTAPDEPERPARLTVAADAFLNRWFYLGDAADFEHGIGLYREALAPDAAEPRSKLGYALALRLTKGQGADSDAGEALACCRETLAIIEPTDPDRRHYLARFAFAAFVQAGRTADAALMDEALAAISQALDAAPLRGPERWLRRIAAGAVMFGRLGVSEREEDLGEVLDFAAHTVNELPMDLPARRGAQLTYGILLYIQVQVQQDPADRDLAITMLEGGLPSLSDSSRPGMVQMIAELRMDRCLATYRLSDIDESIRFFKEQLAITPDDAELLKNSTLMALLRFEITSDPADLPQAGMSGEGLVSLMADLTRAAAESPDELDRSIAVAELALAGLPVDDHHRLALLQRLSSALEARFLQHGNLDDLEHAINLTTACIEGLPPADVSERGATQAELARLLILRSEMTGDQAVLQAVSLAEQAVRAIPLDHPVRAAADYIHGVALLQRFQQDGDAADLAAAITDLQAAVDATPEGMPKHQLYVAGLGAALQGRFERYSDPADSRAATAAAEQSLLGAGTGPGRFAFQAGLGRARLGDFARTGGGAALNAAIDAFQQAIRHLPRNYPAKWSFWSDLSLALKLRAELTGALGDLDAAISAGRKAVDLAASPQQINGKAVNNLADALRIRSNQTGDRADIDDAVALVEDALEVLDDAHQDRLGCELALASSLWHRAALGGDLADLDRAIDAARKALREMADDAPLRPLGYQLLAGCLWSRAKAYGDRSDVDEAIAAQELAISAAPRGPDGQPADHRQLPVDLYNKAGMLLARHELQGRAADLDEAIAANVTALDFLPAGHPLRTVHTGGLAMLLAIRYGMSGQQADLTAAARAAAESLAATPARDPLWASRQHMAGYLRYSQFLNAGRSGDLRAAIRILTASVKATSPDHPNLGGRAHQLSSALLERYRLRGRRRDVQRALTYLRMASQAPAAATGTRLRAARDLGSITLRLGRPAEALDAYLLCVQELLPVAVWRGLGRTSQQHHLKDIAGLACEAAAVALTCDAPRVAVQLLEQGRSVLWSQLLETRSDRSELYATHPDLAEEFDQVCKVLDRQEREDFGRFPAQSGVPSPAPAVVADSESDRRRKAATRFEELRAQIRSLPGFADFLRPLRFDTLQQAAADGPVAIINVDATRCDAILLTAADVQVLPLVQLTEREAIQHAVAFQESLGALSAGVAARIIANQTILATLEWLWTTIAAPVLDAIGDQQRIWWCPTGPLSALPIHAAGLHRPGRPAEWVGHHAVSSYTSTLQALLLARAAPRIDHERRALAVGLQSTPRPDATYRDLPAVPEELQVLREAFGDRATVLEGAAATLAAVAAALPNHPRVHFACHGDQNAADPAASHLALYDTDLTILDVVRTGTNQAELAMLSACRTAQGDAALADESIHLAAAFQLAGYRHVIGTLWNLRDTAAPEIAREVYARVANPNAGHDDTATALHEAVLQLRQLPGFTSPIAWAPYIHFGP